MNRHEEIKNAYKSLGGDATFYDGMITCSTLPGKAVCKLVWNMDKRKNDHYLELALSGIPNNFSGKMCLTFSDSHFIPLQPLHPPVSSLSTNGKSFCRPSIKTSCSIFIHPYTHLPI